jgi:hypothetical protein
MADNAIRTIRIIPFSGKEEDWNRWSKTFMAAATVRGYRDVLVPIDPDEDAALEDNNLAYNDLILSCQEDIAFGIVDESVSVAFPDGDARVAWRNLRARFEPNTGAAKVQLKQEFHQLKLTSAEEDPDPWITSLELKRRRLQTLGATMDDDDMILHILNALPKEYETVVELCEEDLTRGNITLATVKERIRARYKRIIKANSDDQEAIALMAKTQFKKACTVCGKIGHKGADCFTLEKNKDKKEAYMKKMNERRNKGNNRKYKGKGNGPNSRQNNEKRDDTMAMTTIDTEMILMTDGNHNTFHNFTWIADSGATTHMTNSLEGMFDLADAKISISVGDGRKMKTLKTGKWRGTAIDSEGTRRQITLSNVSFVPDLMVNLFSLTAVMDNGFQVDGNNKGINVQKDNWSMRFDKRIGTPKGHVFAITMIPEGNNNHEMANVTVPYEDAHQLLGHPGKNKLIGTSERLKWTLSKQTLNDCSDCLVGKAKRLKLNKESTNQSKVPGERLMIDISSVKTKDSKRIGKYWLLVVDEATSMKWSFFLKSKDSQVPLLTGFIKTLQSQNKKVKYIRCDNAGENLSLQQSLEGEGMNIKFEFTARETPQQNGKVERAFATLYGRMRAMMAAANWNDAMKHKLWMEAAATATKLDTIMNDKGEKSPYQQFYNESPLFEQHLKTFGQVGIMTLKPGSAIKSKLGDRGIKCLFLGYAANHAGNVYRVLNVETNMVMISRDVKWLKTFDINKNSQEQANYDLDDDDELERLQQPVAPDQVVAVNNAANPVRLARELRGLQPFNNPGRLEIEGHNNHLCFFVPESAEEDDTPTTFQEAWYHKDPVKCAKWRQAIRLEFRQMIKNGVWRKGSGINSLPANRKGIGTKWVFKEKKNGVFRARLVAKGYDQIAGIDFQYNFAPVTSEVTLRILLVMWVVNDLFAEIADVQTAFLHGDLEEEIFIKIPPGYKEYLSETKETIDEKFLKLEKATYGLVQAARSWWKKFTTVLKSELGFTQFENDSCLLKRHTSDGQVYLIVYVDDCFVLGDKRAVKQALAEIEKHFAITRSETIEDFIGCRIEKENKSILLSQPDLIKKMMKKFGDKTRDMKDYETPAPSGSHIIRCQDDEAKLNDDEQAEFRSGVGSLLYLLKHSRPDLSNSVRELSKVMDGANKAHQKALFRAIKFVEQTQERKLVLSPSCESLNWEIKAYSDSDFAGDSDTRKSVSGYIIYLNGAAIAWRSKGQKSVSLSSTEAEYMAISEVAMEILYIVGILKFLDMKINYPIEVNVDNIGAVYLSKTATTGNRTKHIDTRYHFVREYIEDGIVKVVFVRSEDNDADIFTKNLNGETFERHSVSIGLKDVHEATTPKMRNRKGVEIGGDVFPT